MEPTEKFSLNWNDFQANLSSHFRELRGGGEFTDVTLVCEDYKLIEVHRVALCAGSQFFKNILKNMKHPKPMIYVKGMKSHDLESVLDFLYYGEISIFEHDLNMFLELAEDLEVKGITRKSAESSQSEPKETASKTKSTINSPTCNQNMKQTNHTTDISLEKGEVKRVANNSKRTAEPASSQSKPKETYVKTKNTSGSPNYNKAVHHVDNYTDNISDLSLEIAEDLQVKGIAKGTKSAELTSRQQQKTLPSYSNEAIQQILNTPSFSEYIDEVKNDAITTLTEEANTMETKTYNSLNDGIQGYVMMTEEENVDSTTPGSFNGENLDYDQQVRSMLGRVDRIWTCTICGKTDGRNSAANLRKHIETHIEGVSFPCGFCGKILRTRNSLNTHRSTRHSSKEIQFLN